ncbi:S41 family peptidase [Specibacter cremeus]|uniref:S41 family peptidase n=1 Tax=Specibacter cremeus TaxID=1629051 RepID=UPI000F78E6FB|nr:S41 family peptidase [Specibacter cremeus]
MTSSSYLRYPHLHADLVTFVAEDDVWLAPLSGGRAWRVSASRLPARNPRFSPDGATLAWTVVRGAAPEVVTTPVDGGDTTRLTYWGHASTKTRGFTAAGDVLVTSAFEQPDARLAWAYAVPTDGGPARRLPFGPLDSLAFGPRVGDERPVVLGSVLSREPAAWKRYRGGTGGKLWLDNDGSGDFERLAAELDGNLCDPMWVGERIAFLSDHEGHGNLYSLRPDGSGLRRHTDHEGHYVRHAATDGTRIVFESAGNLFLLASLDAEPVQLQITLGSASAQRQPVLLDAAGHLGDVVPTPDGRASVVEAHGTVHRVTHKDGPSRVIEATPGVRARLARPVGDERIAYIADHDGVEALYVTSVGGPAPVPEPAGAPAPAVPEPAVPEADEDLPRPVAAAAVNGTEVRAAAGVSTDSTAEGSTGSTAGTVIEPVEIPESLVSTSSTTGVSTGSTTGVPNSTTGEVLRRIELPGGARAAELVASPDGALVAIGTEYGDVWLVDVSTGSVREVSHTDIGSVDELVFSPDSAWLAWIEPVTAEAGRSKLRLLEVAGPADVLDATDGRFDDFSADFTPDGKYLAFLSRRSFDPVYDTHAFDMAFPASTKPYLLALAAGTPSPFGPHPDGTPADPSPAGGRPGEKAGQKATELAAESAVPPVVVDREALGSRVIAVPVPQGRYTALSATDGALLWLVDSGEGVTGDGLARAGAEPTAHRLERFELATAKTTTIVAELDRYRLSGDRSQVVAVRESTVTVRPAGADGNAGKDNHDAVEVDLGRIRVRLDPVRVWGQAFEEAWRLQRDFYYTPDMAGTDWQASLERYRPVVERLGSHDDLVDLLWELHGDLGTSHAYVDPKPVTEAGAGEQGKLGAEFETVADGAVVTRILAGETSDPQAYSPLLAPGVAVRAGDVIEAVNGVPVPAAGIDVLLAGTAGTVVELDVRSAADGDGQRRRRVAVVPLKSEERLRYQEWVAANRAVVRQASAGAFGYLHIPDMQARGWAQLFRDLDTESALDALVVDVRRNRGGHTSQLVADMLGRRMDAWALARGQQSEIYPAQAPRGPVVILADEFAGSDGDIITAVSKLRGIGPVVGMRTWGGVVGIDGKFTLADGTGVTQPRYAFWFRDGAGFSVENYGVDPDIAVPFPPHDHAAGNDPQLAAAVGVLLEMRQEIPTVRPPELAGYRTVAPGALPPRPS